MTTTIEQIKEALRQHVAEAETATAGPWHTHEMSSIYVGNGSPASLWEIVHYTEELDNLTRASQKRLRQNATFIAHARTMSPAACKCLLLAIEGIENTLQYACFEDHNDSENLKDILEQIVQNWTNNQTTKP